MANFDFVVDTNPMADSIHHIGRHVDGVTTAVVSMQAAVILAEQKAADKVCENVNRGFYSLIQSQISQKIAKLRSDVDSKTMEIAQQSMMLASIRGRMERDYMMIAKRYTALFNSLNKALRTRIFELDKYTTAFATKDVESLSARIRILVASVPIHQSESVVSSSVISSSRTRQLGLKILQSMQKFISNNHHQDYKMNRILSKSNSTNNIVKYVPLLISESVGLYNKQVQSYPVWPRTNDTSLNPLLEKNMKIIHIESMNNGEWEDMVGEEKERVNGEFQKLLLGSSCSAKVKNQISGLYSGCSWQKLKVKNV